MELHKISILYNRGITLMEVLVVISIITIVGVSGLFVSMDSYRGYSFRSDRYALISLLQHARAQAIGNVCLGSACIGGMDHGVKIEAGRLILFQGLTYATHNIDQDIFIEINPTLTLSGLSEITFQRLSGDPTQLGTITLLDNLGHISVITIGSEGQISWTH